VTDSMRHGKPPDKAREGVAGVVLCGGRSRRMGRSKALVEFEGRPMLVRIIRRIAPVVEPIVVVAAPGQPLPPLPDNVRVAHDAVAGRGPLEGIRRGLEWVEPSARAAFVVSCDVPRIRAEFVRALIERLDQDDIVVPVDAQHQHVLTAVYRTHLHERIRALQEAGKSRPRDLLEVVRVARIPVDELRQVDPRLDSLANANTPEALADLLQRPS